uniref:Peptidase A2 domain-containing protein n=1 Tax=Haemonchus placei TaxID=6290 RepID=A0A0N4WJ53_HAEPC
LLDTGFEISTLPQKVQQWIEEECHRLQECPINLRKRILDMSENRMKFLKKGHMLVLGTNALLALNYTLVRRSGEDCERAKWQRKRWCSLRKKPESVRLEWPKCRCGIHHQSLWC